MKTPIKHFNYLFWLILATAALLVFGVFTNVLTDLWGSDIKDLFRNNPWLIAGFALLLGLVVYLLDQQRKADPEAETVDIDRYEEAFVKFRANLQEQYEIRLKTKTANRLPINLKGKSTHFGTSPDRVKGYFDDKNLTIESEHIAPEISKILNTYKRLLVIGDPGAGKTTILLFAAINILKDTHEKKLPLLLNLATWHDRRDFAEWYAQSIAHTYSLSSVFVTGLLTHNTVIPFFDGFDEIKKEFRDDCFKKMAAYFGDERDRQLIVSSRKIEYAESSANAPVYAEIEVQPLSLEQIKKSLSENAQHQAADRELLRAVEQDEWLSKAVETPFYLNTASFLFGKGEKTLADFSFTADSVEGRQAEIVDRFSTLQVASPQGRIYLNFVAKKMNTENFLIFELVDVQPSWCKSLWKFRLVGSSIIGLGVGVPAMLLSDSFDGLFFGLIFGLVFLIDSDIIKTEDIQVWNWKTCIKKWKQGILLCLVYGISFGMLFRFYAISYGSMFGNQSGDFAFGLCLGLLVGLKQSGTTTSFLLHVPSAYQRFWATLLGYLWISPVVFLAAVFGDLVSGIMYGNKIWLTDTSVWLKYLFLSLLFLVLFPPVFSGFLEHFILRLILWHENKLPLRIVTFMDRMSDQLIFEDNRRTVNGKKRRGAFWRFRHKILQDYFANTKITGK